MTDEVAGRLSAAEMQQYMTDEALRSIGERQDAADREIARELADMRQKHHEEMAAASAALDAAMAEIERLRAELDRR